MKCGLKRLSPYHEAFRTTISFLNSSNQCIATYKAYCIDDNERPRKFGLDMNVRWNSTYLKLKHLVPHKQSFSVFIQTHYPRVECSPMMLTERQWYVVEHIMTLFELFYDSIIALSTIYDPHLLAVTDDTASGPSSSETWSTLPGTTEDMSLGCIDCTGACCSATDRLATICGCKPISFPK